MSFVLQVLANVAVLLLSTIQLAMLLRAIFSWFPMDSNRFTNFLYGVTEPVIYPIRRLFFKLNWFQESPLDIPFLITSLLIVVVLMFL